MDYSKLKKILMILLIINLIFNLKSKVFASTSFELEDYDYTVTFADQFDDYSYKYVFVGDYSYNLGTSNSKAVYIFCSKSPISLNKKIIQSTYQGTTYDRLVYEVITEDGTSFVYRGQNGSLTETVPQALNFAMSQFNTKTALSMTKNSGYYWYVEDYGTVEPLQLYNFEAVVASSSVSFTDGELIFGDVRPPQLNTSIEDIQSLNFDYLSVDTWGYSEQDVYMLFYDRNIQTNDSTLGLYPINEILLNNNSSYFKPELSVVPSKNSTYWIPNTELGFNYKLGGKYEIRFAIKEQIDSEYTDFAYKYIGEYYDITLNTDIDNDVISSLNTASKDYIDKQRHDQTISAIDKQTQATENLINTNTSIEDDEIIQSGVITEDNEDITASGFNNIFNAFYNGITAEPTDIVLPIPYVNKNITINPNFLRDLLGDNNILIKLIESFYFFIVSLYIVKDIEKIIEKIKNGDIATSTDTNIKADML